MPEWLTYILENETYSYVAVATLFLLCGLGLPLPEEIVLVSAGYVCFQGKATYPAMTAVASAAILVGDLLPFLLGRWFGPRLLRLRWLRFVINRERLAMFNRWFRKRGDMVIMIARFIPGLRVVAFFTGGTMRMNWRRFLFLDLCGIALVAPTFIYVGLHFGEDIKQTFERVQQLEEWILILSGVAAAVIVLWYWLRRRARRQRMFGEPRETFVEPSSSTETGGETEREPSGGIQEGASEVPSADTADEPAAAPAGDLPRVPPADSADAPPSAASGNHVPEAIIPQPDISAEARPGATKNPDDAGDAGEDPDREPGRDPHPDPRPDPHPKEGEPE